MNTIKKDHWFIHNNQLTISLMRFYVEISMINDSNYIYFLLRVVNTEQKPKEISFMFDSLEESIAFTEEVVDECKTFDEIIKNYRLIQDNRSNMLKMENDYGCQKRLQ